VDGGHWRCHHFCRKLYEHPSRTEKRRKGLNGKQDTPFVVTLAIAQTIVWAGLFYIFPIMILRWENGFSWSRDKVALALTLALFCAAAVAPIAGRIVDRGAARPLMTGAAVLGAFGLFSLSTTESYPQFLICWAIIGFACAGCLYEPCFAFLTQVKGPDARRSITIVTLIAGMASTVCYPFADYIAENYGWRTSLQCFAFLIVAVAAPLFWFSIGRLGQQAQPQTARAKTTPPPGIFTSPLFWVLTLSFVAIALTQGMLITHIIPILHERQVSPGQAVLAASLVGPMQVAGRLVIMTFAKSLSAFAIIRLSFIGLSVAALLLFSMTSADWRVFGFVFSPGGCYGVVSVLRPVLTLELLGQQGFGQISGMMAGPYAVAIAISPFLAVMLWRNGGYDLTLLACAAIALVALGLAWAAKTIARQPAD
jgi:predicted MFS family arabinose efflux permease